MDEVKLPSIVIDVTIGNDHIQRNLSDDLRVDDSHINDYLQRSPALTAYWNTLYERQRSIVSRNKVKLERKKAELDKKLRKERRQDGAKVSQAEIEALVLTDNEYIVIEDEYLNNKEVELTLKGAVEAIRELRSTLISLSANLREAGSIRMKSPEQIYRDKMNKSKEEND